MNRELYMRAAYDALLIGLLTMLAFIAGYLVGEWDALAYSSQSETQRTLARVARDSARSEDSDLGTAPRKEGEEPE